jgi:hypothetical protein
VGQHWISQERRACAVAALAARRRAAWEAAREAARDEVKADSANATVLREYHYARCEHAWLLRAEGMILRVIGARLGVSKNMARVLIHKQGRRVSRAMRQTRWALT